MAGLHPHTPALRSDMSRGSSSAYDRDSSRGRPLFNTVLAEVRCTTRPGGGSGTSSRRTPRARAQTCLVDLQAQLSIARIWGGGEGCLRRRHPLCRPVGSIHAGPNPGCFGTGRGGTLYNLRAEHSSRRSRQVRRGSRRADRGRSRRLCRRRGAGGGYPVTWNACSTVPAG